MYANDLKSFMFKVSGYTLTVYLSIQYPFLFTYELGRNFTAGLILFLILLDVIPVKKQVAIRRNEKVKTFISDHFSYILLLFITIFAFGALNEKLFDAHPAEHNTLMGIATNAGFIPNGDGALYLLGIQSFLQYGILTFNTLYRPIAHTFNAVLFKISGSDMIIYFYLTTFLLVGATTYLGNVIAKYLSKSVSAISTFFIILFFSRFQATFMTELSGGITGLFAMAGFISGYMRKNLRSLAAGMLLFAISMQIRMGTIFMAPLIIMLAAVRLKQNNWSSAIKSAAILVVVFISGMLLPQLQLSLFKEKSIVQSNAGYFLYQIQTGSDTWRQVMIDYPKDFSQGKSYDETARKAMEYAKQKFIANPSNFFINYGKKIVSTIIKPWDFLFHFWGLGDGIIGIMLFITLMLTPVLYPIENSLRIFWWLLFLMILGGAISSPALEEVRRRTYAASIAVNAISVSIAIANMIQILRICLEKWSDISKNRELDQQSTMSSAEPIREVIQEPAKAGIIRQLENSSGIVIALLIFIGPIIIDQNRKTFKTDLSGYNFSTADSLNQFFLLDPKNSPGVKIHMGQDFKVRKPDQIPKTKLLNNNNLCDTLTGNYYIFNALNLLSKVHNPGGLPFVMIPEKLVAEIDMDNSPQLLLAGKIIKPKRNILFMTEQIQHKKELAK